MFFATTVLNVTIRQIYVLVRGFTQIITTMCLLLHLFVEGLLSVKQGNNINCY